VGISIHSPWEGSGRRWWLANGEATRRKLGIDGAGSGTPPAKPRAPAWASVFGDPSAMVDLARAVAHRRSGELNTTSRVSICASQNLSLNGHYI
jgi:hypothetical protein